MSKEIVRIADVAMYDSKPFEGLSVRLMSMTENPLRVMASAAEMYRGVVVTDVTQISRKKATEWLDDMLRTGTRAPLEFVHLHFLLDGVTRAFTHQLVRQRTGVYVQESMRFAVKRDAAIAVQTPPSIAVLKEDDPLRILWDSGVHKIGEIYNALIDNGIPSRGTARGLLPTNMTTRIHYHTNLRGLMDHAGMRLCSQAQYEWKQVWALMIRAIRNAPYELEGHSFNEAWQYDAISKLFKPVCFHTGKCEFMAATDRFCSIRERVQAHYAKGEKSDTWGRDIDPLEPLMEGAARMRPGQNEHRFYLAASFAQKPLMHERKRELEDKGYIVTSTWHEEFDEEYDFSSSLAQHKGRRDISDIRSAWAVIFFTDVPSTTGGFHVEFGYALCSLRTIIIVGPLLNIFHNQADFIYPDWEHSRGGSCMRPQSKVRKFKLHRGRRRTPKMDAEERQAAAERGMALPDGVLKPEYRRALRQDAEDEERRAAVEEFMDRAREMEKDWEMYRKTCEDAAVAFLDACSLEPTPDAIHQLTEAFLPALAIMCQRGSIYDPNGGSWKAMGWKGVLLESKKRWSRVRISAWKNGRYNPGDAIDMINYLGYYIRFKHEGAEFGEMDE